MSQLPRRPDNGSPRDTAKANLTSSKITDTRADARTAAGRIGALGSFGKRHDECLA